MSGEQRSIEALQGALGPDFEIRRQLGRGTMATVYLATETGLGRFVACGVASATILAWFHGEAGKQKTNVLEWILLSVIGVVWLSISAWIVLGS